MGVVNIGRDVVTLIPVPPLQMLLSSGWVRSEMIAFTATTVPATKPQSPTSVMARFLMMVILDMPGDL